jgi:energy-coupling factor transporter ATP-binding protein EcfA2
MLQRLRIRNFRGIPDLVLDDLAKVNIFIGTNGSGKTTLLEAISVVGNPAIAPWLVTLSQWREMPPPSAEQTDALGSYFHEFDFSLQPTLEFTLDGHRDSITIQAEVGPSEFLSTEVTSAQPASSGEAQSRLRALRLTYTPEHSAPSHSTLQLTPNGAHMAQAPTVPRIGSFYVHARRSTSAGETARLLTYLYETKRDSDLLGILKSVDPRVKRLWPGVRDVGPTVLVDVGLSRMLPMTLLGDGFCRVLLMTTGLLLTNSRFLMVDEIDSGLHYSVMPSVWNGLSTLPNQKQVFCATHNEEMLHATLGAFESNQDALRIFRVDRQEDGAIEATKYTYESYRVSSAAGLEIR